MSTTSWNGSAAEGFLTHDLAFNTQIRFIALDLDEYHPAIYAVYLMQRFARDGQKFIALDTEGSPLASYDPTSDKITAIPLIHEAISALNLIADTERKNALRQTNQPPKNT